MFQIDYFFMNKRGDPDLLSLLGVRECQIGATAVYYLRPDDTVLECTPRYCSSSLGFADTNQHSTPKQHLFSTVQIGKRDPNAYKGESRPYGQCKNNKQECDLAGDL